MHRQRRPMVSVVTPSFNQGRFIEKTLRSVLCQNYPAVEYVVVDGQSKDETAAILGRYADVISNLIREPDAGFADALHKGFSKAGGEILAYLNADDCYAGPHVITRAVAVFERNPQIEVLFGKRVLIDENGYFISRWPYVPFDAATLLRVDFIPQECCFWRRSAWERAGGFIDRGLDFAVDYDLWLRFLDAGARFLSINETFGLFREHASQKSQSRWHEVGWPEIRNLQQARGVNVPEAELLCAFERHAFGTGMFRKFKRAIHGLGDRLAARVTGGEPLDAWSLNRPLPSSSQPALSA